MSSLAVGFALRMPKLAASTRRETTPDSEAPDGKHPKRSGPEEEVQKSGIVVTLKSLERSSESLPALEGTA